MFNSGPVARLYLIRNEFGCELDGMRVRRKGGKAGGGEGGGEGGKKSPTSYNIAWDNMSRVFHVI